MAPVVNCAFEWGAVIAAMRPPGPQKTIDTQKSHQVPLGLASQVPFWVYRGERPGVTHHFKYTFSPISKQSRIPPDRGCQGV